MSENVIRKKDSLEYHEKPIPGKIEVVPTKKTKTQRDLSLAYSPGVADPCLEIADNKEDVYKYTAKGNLVGVISNGTAVLGLGDIGPEASKPVMEGKGVLFKIFAGIDVFDIEIDAKDPKKFIEAVKTMEPTFGGINLEDIKAPDCFEIEQTLKKEMNIPVMHDDQHGTAIISGAALLNAAEIIGKDLKDLKVVVSGAGASAVSCINIFFELGVERNNAIVCDSRGVIRKDREGLSGNKLDLATATDVHTLEEALVGADVFLGLSRGNVMTPEMLLTMAKDPIVFALANPTPEIAYDLAMSTRDDVMMATGRSDHPNQVNNVLGFPYIFRGALDVRATEINEPMKLACVRAIAELAKEPVPETVTQAYNVDRLVFGREYFIPKPLDTRLLTTVAPAVAKAAMETGVAKAVIDDMEAYKEELIKRMGSGNDIMRRLSVKASSERKRVVFAEADNPHILRAARIAMDDGIIEPILLGRRSRIRAMIEALELDELANVQIINPRVEETTEARERYGKHYYSKRQRMGATLYEAQELMSKRSYFAAMMVELGDADAMIAGLGRNYISSLAPALRVIGTEQDQPVATMYMVLTDKGPLFLADTTMIEDPTVDEIVDITEAVAIRVKEFFKLDPRVALLSYSNFGSSKKGKDATKMRQAREILKERNPNLPVDGDIQANFALNPQVTKETFPFSDLAEAAANVLIFPNLSSANIALKLLEEVAGTNTVGPIVMGMNKPAHILQMGANVQQIVDMITIANLDAQQL
ncbi:NADP-dependent malic enzyme [Flammeovirga kamogawensis]|uniref:NADP-dependent malic enzyme n=1 Tax=Flammeovirga kamogawensis TaxID=373891 RepID=A0ABX8GZ26_9BACT|nr:NADP-dependent malic enzyme [Flammeovirga kamogawensis]MBB6459015.1 malate dehydrogenase (oxaloacetate-decarboxylating)(NADP+) [Flammeovirga kamogawensis]QWG08588.1 NADP-dependent malic enzyme [Flammeovirga kamogawensis]TRX66880.1 NADP-dependent malic enzyme [Flammeovirga kamogawensis]